jgi:hypothetical protein
MLLIVGYALRHQGDSLLTPDSRSKRELDKGPSSKGDVPQSSSQSARAATGVLPVPAGSPVPARAAQESGLGPFPLHPSQPVGPNESVVPPPVEDESPFVNGYLTSGRFHAPPDAIRMALVLNEHVTGADLNGLVLRAINWPVRLVALVAPGAELDAADGVRTVSIKDRKFIFPPERELTIDRDIWRVLKREDVDVMVFVEPLKNQQVHDDKTGAIQPSLGVLLRNVRDAVQARKDVYVSSSAGDAVIWRYGPTPNEPPPGTEEFFKNEFPISSAGLMMMAKKFARVTSYGGNKWEDFAEFLECVKSRAEPTHSFQKLSPDGIKVPPP